jgi:hypothetical protein
MKVERFFVTMDVAYSHLDSMLDGSQWHNISNHKNLKSKVTNQGAWELVVPTCYDEVCE